MLSDSLKSILNAPAEGCMVGKWLKTKDEEVRTLFEQLAAKKGINLTELFKAITAEEQVPFKKTLFTYHMRGTCSCQQN
jgi:hypothetical protein